MTKVIFQEMADRWPSAIVARTEIDKFSGGMMSGKYLANLDCQGVGPVRVVCGRKVGYPVKDLCGYVYRNPDGARETRNDYIVSLPESLRYFTISQ